MIRCIILVEEMKGGLSVAVLPEAVNPTDLERSAWAAFNEALAAVMQWQQSTAQTSSPPVLLTGGEEIRGLVEERLKNLEPIRRKKKKKKKIRSINN